MIYVIKDYVMGSTKPITTPTSKISDVADYEFKKDSWQTIIEVWEDKILLREELYDDFVGQVSLNQYFNDFTKIEITAYAVKVWLEWDGKKVDTVGVCSLVSNPLQSSIFMESFYKKAIPISTNVVSFIFQEEFEFGSDAYFKAYEYWMENCHNKFSRKILRHIKKIVR